MVLPQRAMSGFVTESMLISVDRRLGGCLWSKLRSEDLEMAMIPSVSEGWVCVWVRGPYYKWEPCSRSVLT